MVQQIKPSASYFLDPSNPLLPGLICVGLYALWLWLFLLWIEHRHKNLP